MNDMIKQMVQPLLDAFNMYKISNQSIKDEVNTFKKRLLDFAETQNDIMTYYSEFAKAGLQEEYTNLISKVALASTNQELEDNNQENSNVDITVHDFLLQYKPAYDEVVKRGSVKGRAAYEKLFDVENRTDDILDAQIIIEKERMLWNIVKDDALEILENKLEKMDPLFLASTSTLLGQIAAYNQSDSEEELDYRLLHEEIKSQVVASSFSCRMFLSAMLAKLLIEYIRAKRVVIEWKDDKAAKAGLETMIEKRKNIRALSAFLDKYFGFNINDLIENPSTAIWMLNPENLDEFGKTKKVLGPKNLLNFKNILET